MVTHKEAVEAIKKLSAYCNGRDCYNDCVCCDMECNGFYFSDKEIRIIEKEAKRLESEDKCLKNN